MFWASRDLGPLSAALAQWRPHYPDLRIYHDEDVWPLLRQYVGDAAVDMYRAIRNATCRSDVARYLLLYEHGGLYVDYHVALLRPQGLQSALELAASQDPLMVVERQRAGFAARPPWAHYFISSVIYASKPRVPFFLECARHAVDNLTFHRHLETAERRRPSPQFVPYHQGDLAGPGLFTDLLLQPGTMRRTLRRDMTVQVHFEEGFCLQRGGNRPSDVAVGPHWFEQQKSTPLFYTAEEEQQQQHAAETAEAVPPPAYIEGTKDDRRAPPSPNPSVERLLPHTVPFFPRTPADVDGAHVPAVAIQVPRGAG
jgi:hypothetical protein